MTNFLLVHGSGHGAWCWRDLIPELVARGHTARAIDLPGSGDDRTPATEVSLESYGRAIIAALDAPSIVVGHSAGGFAVAQAAELDPRNITRLVYICAYMPRPGVSLVEMRRESPSQPLTGALETSPDGHAYRFRDRALAANLYQDCAPEIAEFASAHLSWQPTRPQIEAVKFTGKGALVPRSCIICENDHTIPPEHQRKMVIGVAPKDIHSIATGHSPFFAAPGKLAALLDKIATA